MKKAKHHSEVVFFEQIPNIGSEMARDFKLLGLKDPKDLSSSDPIELYVKLCQKTRRYHDPCVLDTFMAATEFMKGKSNKKWWEFSEHRKANFNKVLPLVEKWKG